MKQVPRIFNSPSMQAIVALAKKVGPTDIPILICGETGVGKEVVAELIHASSERKNHEIVCINCAGLPADLIESELFGSIRGAFTGSQYDRNGLFKSADCSTVFLDELSEMPLGLQSKLLRVLQDKRVRKVGATTFESVNVRVIASINRPPRDCIHNSKLREDLFYRLGTVTVTVPPLRDRPDDIIPIAKAYLEFYAEQFKRPVLPLPDKVRNLLLDFDWPGNVRQLQNEMSRLALLCENEIKPDDLSIDHNDLTLQRAVKIDIDTLTPLQSAEASTIVDCLVACGWNKLMAAKKLGMGRQTLYTKIKLYAIKTPATDAQLAERTLLHNEHASPQASRVPAQAPLRVVQRTDPPEPVSLVAELPLPVEAAVPR